MTTWSDDVALQFRKQLQRDHINYTVQQSQVNRHTTYFIGPDGSSETWPQSDAGDDLRDHVIAMLEKYKYEDGSSPWKWVEVAYGEDGQRVTRGNNENRL